MPFSIQPVGSLLGQFLEASFRGVPFAVMGGGGGNGRRTAVHDYPGRDGVWVEDLGRKGRSWRVTGFLVGPLAYTQRDLILNAVEQKGSGILVHPSMGVMNVCCTGFDWRERDGVSNVVDLSFEFVEQKELLNSLITTGLHGAIAAASMAFGMLSASGYVQNVSSFFKRGSSVPARAARSATDWAAQAVDTANAPAAVPGITRQISGENGRYLGNAGTLSTEHALSVLSTGRQAIGQAQVTLAQARQPDTLAQNVQAFLSTVQAAMTDPLTLLDILFPLATVGDDLFQSLPGSATLLEDASRAARLLTLHVCSQQGLAVLAVALSDWQPTSSADAQTMVQRVSTLFDRMALLIGESDDDGLFQALERLAALCVQDLLERGARLPDIIALERPTTLPALTLAQQLYADGSRSDALVQRVNPVHPAFMPPAFEALSY